MTDGFEVDFASLRSFSQRLPRLSASALADVPQGTGVYGFPVLAHAVHAMTTALQDRLADLEAQIAAAREDLGSTVRSYEAVDDAVAHRLAPAAPPAGVPVAPLYPGPSMRPS